MKRLAIQCKTKNCSLSKVDLMLKNFSTNSMFLNKWPVTKIQLIMYFKQHNMKKLCCYIKC